MSREGSISSTFSARKRVLRGVMSVCIRSTSHLSLPFLFTFSKSFPRNGKGMVFVWPLNAQLALPNWWHLRWEFGQDVVWSTLSTCFLGFDLFEHGLLGCLISSKHDPVDFLHTFPFDVSDSHSHHDSTQQISGSFIPNVGAISTLARYCSIPVYFLRLCSSISISSIFKKLRDYIIYYQNSVFNLLQMITDSFCMATQPISFLHEN